MEMERGREKLASSELGTSKPSQVEVAAEGMRLAVLTSWLLPLEIVRVQVPEERYWSILTRTMSLSPEKRAVVSEPVREALVLGSSPSYWVGVLSPESEVVVSGLVEGCSVD